MSSRDGKDLNSLQPGMSARAEAKTASREALVSAGVELLAEGGLDGPSLDRICAVAGYTRGAFYVHFADRDAFVAAVMEHLLAGWVDTIVSTEDAAGDLTRSIHLFVDALEAAQQGRGDPVRAAGAGRLHLLIEGCRRSPAISARFATVVSGAVHRVATRVAAGQAAGTLRCGVDPHGLASLLVAAVVGLLVLSQTGGSPDLRRAEAATLALLVG